MKMTINIETFDHCSFDKNEFSKIHTLLRESFEGHFTSLLTRQQLRKYLCDISNDIKYSKFHIAFKEGEIIGFAAVGSEVSLMNVFKKIESIKNFTEAFMLLIRLILNPKIFFSTLRNLIIRNSKSPKFQIKKNNASYLAYICTDRLITSKGLGTKLIRSILKSLREAEIQYIYCYMDATSHAVNRFYVKNDWIVLSKNSPRSIAYYKVF